MSLTQQASPGASLPGDTPPDRIPFLEAALEAHSRTMDVLASTTAIFGEAEHNRDPERIVHSTVETLRRLLPALDMAVYLVDDESSFNLAHQEHPDAPGPALPETVEELIRQGTFSWALQQNHPVILSAADEAEDVLLHVISTRTRVRGMLAARLPHHGVQRHEPGLTALTVVLFNAAYALENAELFHLMERRHKALERITEQQSQELLHHMSHDRLTGLPNRMLFTDRLVQAIDRHAGTGSHVAVLLLDVDHFKRLNESLGHRAGDELIRRLAEELGQLLQDSRDRAGRPLRTTLARLGGDEFGILVEDLQGLESCVRLVTEVVRTAALERDILDHSVTVSTSCGIAVYPYDGEAPDTLLGNAEVAMYEAKDRGRNGFRFYTPDLEARTSRHHGLKKDLARALAADQLVLHYQPRVDLASGAIVGAEALIRWQHPEHGLLFPDDFIAMAEEMTLIEEIGEWVLRRVCSDLNRLAASGGRMPRISINVSARQLRQPELAAQFANIIREAGIPNERIELELTETAVMDDVREAARIFQRLRDLGMPLTVDDFGSGNASLIQLKQLPADAIKIDRSFVKDLDHNEGDRRIVHAIVLMARSLGLEVVAEGVDSPGQAAILHELDCRLAQGYYFAHPAPLAEFEALWRDGATLPLAGRPHDSGDPPAAD